MVERDWLNLKKLAAIDPSESCLFDVSPTGGAPAPPPS